MRQESSDLKDEGKEKDFIRNDLKKMLPHNFILRYCEITIYIKKEDLAVFCNALSNHKVSLGVTQWAFKTRAAQLNIIQ